MITSPTEHHASRRNFGTGCRRSGSHYVHCKNLTAEGRFNAAQGPRSVPRSQKIQLGMQGTVARTFAIFVGCVHLHGMVHYFFGDLRLISLYWFRARHQIEFRPRSGNLAQRHPAMRISNSRWLTTVSTPCHITTAITPAASHTTYMNLLRFCQ